MSENKRRDEEERYEEEERVCGDCYYWDWIDGGYCTLWKRPASEYDPACEEFDEDGVFAPIPVPLCVLETLIEKWERDDP